MREGKVASIWIQILATFPSRIYRREVKSTLSQKPFGRPWVRLATCIVCFAWFRSDHVQRVHRVQRVLVCTASLHQSAHTPWFEPTAVYGLCVSVLFIVREIFDIAEAVAAAATLAGADTGRWTAKLKNQRSFQDLSSRLPLYWRP